jgi:hypothetical protein
MASPRPGIGRRNQHGPSASLFPHLYDFTLNTFIYYFPDTKNAGHYTTNPRVFSNLRTGQIFEM